MRTHAECLSLTVAILAMQVMAGPRATATRFLLQHPETQTWSVYGNEKEWRTAVDSTAAQEVGTVTYTKGRISQVVLTVAAESGDWIVIDNYSVAPSGAFVSLSRTIKIQAADLKVEHVYKYPNGQPMLRTQVSRSLKTGRRVRASDEWLPEIPVVSHFRAFPFARLLDSGA